MPTQKKYRALTGLHYPATAKDVAAKESGEPFEWRDVEAGEVVSDTPPESIGWLLAGGHIEEVTSG